MSNIFNVIKRSRIKIKRNIFGKIKKLLRPIHSALSFLKGEAKRILSVINIVHNKRMITFEKLRRKPRELKTFTGLSVEQFSEILEALEPAYAKIYDEPQKLDHRLR